ncbi:MAG: TetR family transcriptional regulator [Microbacterium gubbeenense]|uniref:TetR/AcrR family transcriptional regulator n=1 Tax=Microbacterium gubbeenense TaxID=159896 RepID=UPI003F9C9FCC
MSTPDNDPIVHAAVMRFAVEGFDAPLRGIGADAGVSAALIMKRFGSKQGLREATDRYVLEWIRAARTQHAGEAAGGHLLAALAQHDEYAPLIIYVVHSILEGSDLGHDVVDQIVADTEDHTSASVEQGAMRPSRDERARARYMALSGLGSFLLTILLRPDGDDADLASVSRRFAEEQTLPVLELYTEGALTSSAQLDEHLQRHS